MRHRNGKRLLALLIATSLRLLMGNEACAQVIPTITYQGRLVDQGTLANGSYDFEVGLFIVPTGGSQVGSTVLADDVAVLNGLFTLQLDFEYGWPGYEHYLQIGVRKGDSGGEHALLLPRQRVAAAPQALYSLGAGFASSAGVVPFTGITGLPAGLADGDDDTTYTPGSGLVLNGDELSVDTATIGSTHTHFGQTWSGPGSGTTISTDSTENETFGLRGLVASTTPGVFSAGVRGTNESTTGSGIGVYGEQKGGGWGVYGTSVTGRGVYGYHTSESGTEAGVHGDTDSKAASATGVFGQVTSIGAGNGSAGVRGINQSTSDQGYGIYGEHKGTGYGVYGKAGALGYGVVGQAGAGGFAGRFFGAVGVTGNMSVSGTLSKGAGSFRIDHPLDPANKLLYHSFVESPDMLNLYNGNVVLDGRGEAAIELPPWFGALNRDFRYQLTAIGAAAPDLHVAEEVRNNRFRIAGGKAGTKVSWQVTGIRQDAYANAHRIPVEVDKPAAERGSYLHPDVIGKAGQASGDAP